MINQRGGDKMKIYASIVAHSDGIDCEFLTECPTDSFVNGLNESLFQGNIFGFEIREGNVNGGDSITVEKNGILRSGF